MRGEEVVKRYRVCFYDKDGKKTYSRLFESYEEAEAHVKKFARKGYNVQCLFEKKQGGTSR